ncbi:MAG: type VI secretion system baseplate subunit TssF [Deltaproteobacteria bacterium]|jgi:type VI secretion system protein ImpG|nr:type VI secretion system baseplate subunit TssF [Deltaproteobacteria bacterium]
MIKKYYQEELANLRELALDFGRAHPALAPMLDSKGSDPDVERLLEGVAFMSSLVRRRLDEGFPRMVEALMEIMFPALIKPIPAMTLIQFFPAIGFNEATSVRRGAQLASVPVDGVKVRFATTTSSEILPAQVVKVKTSQRHGGEGSIELIIRGSAPVGQWCSPELVIHLAGDYGPAAELRRLLLRKTAGVTVSSGSLNFQLGPAAVQSNGLDYRSNSQAADQFLFGYGLLREYFAMPQKFMFIRVTGLDNLSSSTEPNLSLVFNLTGLKESLANLKPELFLLNVVPAINLFRHPANPISVDHKHDEYRLTAQREEAEKLSIHSVRKITATRSDGTEYQYAPFDYFSQTDDRLGSYWLRSENSIRANQTDRFINLVYRRDQGQLLKETLSVELECFNQGVTDFLRVGDVREPTDTSPAMAVFSNIIAPVKVTPALEGEEMLWRLLSHLHVNLMPLANIAALKDILTVYSGTNDIDPLRKITNARKVAALSELRVTNEEHFFRGYPIRGTALELVANGQDFASLGDLCLFSEVLATYFGSFLSLNTFSRLTVIDNATHEDFRWPARLGSKKIL